MSIDFNLLAELAQLSYAAYDDAAHQLGHIQGKIPTGWTALSASDLGLAGLSSITLTPPGLQEFTSNGYFHFWTPTGLDVEAFAAVSGNTVVIAFRGTEPNLSSGLISDLQTDFAIPLGSLSFALSGVSDFIDAVKNYVSTHPGYTLLTTGHSLGGALAEALKGDDGSIAGGAGFGSPGVSLFPHSGSDSSFLHVTRESDKVGTLFDASHYGVTIALRGDGLSFVQPLFASHDMAIYRDQIAELAHSTAFNDVLPQTYAGSDNGIFVTRPDLAISGTAILTGEEAVLGGDQNDAIGSSLWSASPVRIGGGDGNDVIFGGSQGDILSGDGGADTIYGGYGSDVVHGGDGDDQLIEFVGSGIASEVGNDTLYGDGGNDTIDAGNGQNTVYGGPGNDTIWAGSGNDKLYGEGGNDTIHASGGSDLVLGGDGADLVFGDEEGDDLRGEHGNDAIYGGQGNDTLYGGEDADQLYGEGGLDSYIGGSGADTFYFDSTSVIPVGPAQIEHIWDYNQGNGSYSDAEGDVIDISAIVSASGGTGQPDSALWRIDRQFGTAYLSVDPDGAGGAYGWQSIAELHGLPSGATVNVRTGSNGGTPGSQTVPSAPGSYAISPSSRTVDEDAGTITFTVTRPDGTLTETVYISTTFNRGSANNGDYQGLLNVPLTFAAGQTSRTVQIQVNDDNNVETLEQFGLIIQSSPDQPANQYLASASFTIVDDDAGTNDVFTTGNDIVWIGAPNAPGVVRDGLAGDDIAVLDLRTESNGFSTSRNNLDGSFGVVSGSNTLTLHGVESFMIIGGSGIDTIRGGAGDDFLFGGGGNDTIDPGGPVGIDILDGGAGDDTFQNVGLGDTVEGGSGVDWLYFNLSGMTSGLNINLLTGQGAGASWTGVRVSFRHAGQRQ